MTAECDHQWLDVTAYDDGGNCRRFLCALCLATKDKYGIMTCVAGEDIAAGRPVVLGSDGNVYGILTTCIAGEDIGAGRPVVLGSDGKVYDACPLIDADEPITVEKTR